MTIKINEIDIAYELADSICYMCHLNAISDKGLCIGCLEEVENE